MHELLSGSSLPEDQYIGATPSYAASSVRKPLTCGVSQHDVEEWHGWVRFNLLVAVRTPNASNIKLQVRQLANERIAAGEKMTKTALAEIQAGVRAAEIARTPVTKKAHAVWLRRMPDDGVPRGPDMVDDARGDAYGAFLDGGEKQLEMLALLLAKYIGSPLSPVTMRTMLGSTKTPDPIESAEGTSYPGLVGSDKDHTGVFLTWLWSKTTYGTTIHTRLSRIDAALSSPFVFTGDPATGPETSTFADGQLLGADVRTCVRAGKILTSAGLMLGMLKHGGGIQEGVIIGAYSPSDPVIRGFKLVTGDDGTPDDTEVMDSMWDAVFDTLAQLYDAYWHARMDDKYLFADALLSWRTATAYSES